VKPEELFAYVESS